MRNSYSAYPKIYTLGHPYIRDLFEDEVVITEKIDGSQFSFGVFNGILHCRSKGQELDLDNPNGMFEDAVLVVKKYLKHKLRDGWTYRGEYLRKPKHNTLAYDRIPKNHIILFDINDAWEHYVHYDEMVAEGKRLGLEAVPMIFRGMIHKSEPLCKIIDRLSILGGQQIEGIVIKNYLRYGRDGKQLMGKYVSERFKEQHNKNRKAKNNRDIISEIISRLKTEARWDKQVQHLKERGELLNEAKDIGRLIKELRVDLREECEEQIKSWLFEWAYPKIEHGVSGGIAEWYKNKLLEQQFEGEEECQNISQT
ncbi:MAG: RNA ligase family protein [Candidatus Scalindua sp.]